MPRRKVIKSLLSDSSDDDEPLLKKVTKTEIDKQKQAVDNESSSDSDIASYLQPADKINLDSEFFNLQKDNPSFDRIETEILASVNNKLSDFDSDIENEEIPTPPTEESGSKLNFQQLHEYVKKIEEVKKHAEEYEARKRKEEKQIDISNLLAAGEFKKKHVFGTGFHSSDFESCSEKECWNDVSDEEEKSIIPKEGVQITVEMPGGVKKKKGVDLMTAIKRRINRVRKENQILVHKVHLLCWIAHGNYLSSVINSQNVLAVSLSLLPSDKCYPPDRTDLNYLEQIVKWYRNTVVIEKVTVPNNKSLEQLLESQITNKLAFDKKMFVYIFISILRSLGIQCRLVLSFQVEPLRPPNSELCSLSMKDDNNAKAGSSKTKTEKPSKSTTKGLAKPSSNNKPNLKRVNELCNRNKVKNSMLLKNGECSKLKTDEKKKPRSQSSNEPVKCQNDSNKLRSSSMTDKGPSKSNKRKIGDSASTSKGITKSSVPQIDGANDDNELLLLQLDGANDTETSSKPNLKKLKNNQKSNYCSKDHPKRLKTKITKFKDTDSEEESTTNIPYVHKNSAQLKLKKVKESPQVNDRINFKKLKERPLGVTQSKFFGKKAIDVRNDIINIVKSSIKEQKEIDRSRMVKKRRSVHESDDNSDYAPEEIKKKRRDSDDELSPKIKVKKRVQIKPEEESVKKKQGLDVWAEVFLETEEKWISVDVVKGQVHCISELYTRATHPVCYIVAWNNNNSLKDITRRYCKNFNTITRKLRVDYRWWEATLKPFLALKTAREREEDEELEIQQLEMPLPTSITEYKNHPLYVLKRHLLKFQAIYPPDAPILGFVKKEPVYSRHCVYTLHSREVWLKHAKVVKPGEKPYKIVKARARYDKLSNSRITDQMVEIFGPWQTEDYVPPTAENGVVPRNAYGNVELFKPCMLPKKTVHLQLPGLNKIAKRMDIDCAPAVVGFDFHTGGSHPTFDGFVVCEEFAEVLIAAWELEQDELATKQKEKVEKRVYGNWRRLIRGLLIRERLKAKYEFGESSNKGKKKLTHKKKTADGSKNEEK